MRIHWNNSYNDLCVSYIEKLRSGLNNTRNLSGEAHELLRHFSMISIRRAMSRTSKQHCTATLNSAWSGIHWSFSNGDYVLQ